MEEQQAKYGAIPEDVSKTAQGNPGTFSGQSLSSELAQEKREPKQQEDKENQ